MTDKKPTDLTGLIVGVFVLIAMLFVFNKITTGYFPWDSVNPICKAHSVDIYIKYELNASGKVRSYDLGNNHAQINWLNGSREIIWCN